MKKFLSLVVLLAASSALAVCPQDSPPLVYDWSASCSDVPTNPRAMYPTMLSNDRMLVSSGNNLIMLDVSNPLVRNPIAFTSFGVGNLGDSDWDLLSVTVCEGCPLGMAVYKLATVFFEVGHDGFGTFRVDSVLGEIPHGVTYKVGGQQYLIAAGPNNYECSGWASGVYRYDAIDHLELVECVEPLAALTGGIQHGDMLYVSTGTGIYITQPTEHGLGSLVEWAPGRIIGSSQRGLAIDDTECIAVTVHAGTMRVWDISDPAVPALLSVTAVADPPSEVPVSMAALNYPIAWVGTYNATNAERAFDLTDPEYPVEFWDASEVWNEHPCQTIQTGSEFVGSYLFAGRFEVLQRIDFSTCVFSDPNLIFLDGFESGGLEQWQ